MSHIARMKRQYRLRKNVDFQHVRRDGQARSNRFVVLMSLPNRLNHSRFGFSVSKRIGKAVQRNKIKRQMREVVRLRRINIQSGWDLLFVARVPIAQCSYQVIDQAIGDLLKAQNLLVDGNSVAETAGG